MHLFCAGFANVECGRKWKTPTLRNCVGISLIRKFIRIWPASQSVTHLYLLISNVQPFFSFSVLVSSSWGYWIRKSTIICCIKSFNLFGCHVVDEFLKKMSCLFTFLWIYLPLHLYLWPSTFAYTALKPNRVHSKQHFLPLFLGQILNICSA